MDQLSQLACAGDGAAVAAFKAGYAAGLASKATCQVAGPSDDAVGLFPNLRCCNTGSWPKPSWLYSGAPSHTQQGDEYVIGWATKDEVQLEKLQDKATAWAVQEQLDTGLDIITDGEQKREVSGAREGVEGEQSESESERA